MKMSRVLSLLLTCALLAGCMSTPTATPGVPDDPTVKIPAVTITVVKTPAVTIPAVKTPTATIPAVKIPDFDHIVIIVLENTNYATVDGNIKLPYLNALAEQNVLLTRYYAVAHPSLPNYIALIGGSTFGISENCDDCFLNHPSLPDLIEQSGRTWKTYQEDLREPCGLGNEGQYRQKHNPFAYFDPIRLDEARCSEHIDPLTQLSADLQAGDLPNYAFITPNMCNSGHDCEQKVVDDWLKEVVGELQASPVLERNSLIVITYDEDGEKVSPTCCGIEGSGGQVFTVLISPLARPGFRDDTPLNHYSLLKTILRAWDLPDLEATANPGVQVIRAPWKMEGQP